MTIYTHTIVCTIPAPLNAIGAAVARMLDPDTGGAESFAIKLSKTGKAPATHLAMSMPCSEGDYLAAPYLLGDSAMLLSSIERDNDTRWPESEPPTIKQIESFVAGVVFEIPDGLVRIVEVAP